MKKLLNAFHEADRSGRLFFSGSSILIALSGGPDSVCLALLLRSLRRSRRFRLAAAHVHHGLRTAADADARWAGDFCARQGIEFHLLKIDARARASAASESVEEAARQARYAALLDLAKSHRFDTLATGHTADDQAETVLMRLAMGSGLWGLAAIPPVRVERGIRIVRPLLGIRKRDVLDGLKRAGAAYRVDRTNASLRFLRNRIRRELLPRMTVSLNPRIAEHLADMASDAREWRVWAEKRAEDWLRRSAVVRKGAVHVDARSLQRLPAPLRTVVYFRIASRLTGRGQHLRREHVRQTEALLAATRPTAGQPLALGLSVRMSLVSGRMRMRWTLRRPV